MKKEVSKKKRLRVAVKEFPPLVEKKDKVYSGFEVELWKKIAQDLKLDYSFVQNSPKTIISNVHAGKVDVGFGGVSINAEREKLVDFSHSDFDSGLSLVQLRKKTSFFGLIKSFFNGDMLKIFSTLLFFIFIMGNIMWFAERGSTFSEFYLKGILEAVWWGVVTVSTVGYGDYSPLTVVGRLIGIVVILLGLAIFGLYVAEVSSLITIRNLRKNIASIGDFKGKTIATKKGSTSEDLLNNLGVRVVSVKHIETGFKKLESSEVDALVFDSPVVLDYLNKNKKRNIEIVGQISKEKYGFITRNKNPILGKINLSLLKLKDSGFYDSLYQKHFGKTFFY